MQVCVINKYNHTTSKLLLLRRRLLVCMQALSLLLLLLFILNNYTLFDFTWLHVLNVYNLTTKKKKREKNHQQ